MIYKRKIRLAFRSIACLVMVSFCLSLITPPQRCHAQTLANLPSPGVMVPLSAGFNPPILKGLKIHPDHPFLFNFIIDQGSLEINKEDIEKESSRLIKYFLVSLAIPEEDLWVNLSPYEKDLIVSQEFGITEMGRDLLTQDYVLKQIMASLTYPDSGLGQKFWDRIYQKAYEEYGTTDIPFNTFNKVWIIPEEAVVYESGNMAFVVESHLRVMLEEDYLALNNNLENKDAGTDQLTGGEVKDISNVSSLIAKEVLLSEIEKEVNTGKNFVFLRQIYNSLILATWYKQRLKDTLLNKVYSDQKKIAGIDIEDKEIKQKIYEQYVEAFRSGVYDIIREDYDPYMKTVIPRKYFSGGCKLGQVPMRIEQVHKIELEEALQQEEDAPEYIDVMAAFANTKSTPMEETAIAAYYQQISDQKESLSNASEVTPGESDGAMLTSPKILSSGNNLLKVKKAKVDEIHDFFEVAGIFPAKYVSDSIDQIVGLGEEIIPYLIEQVNEITLLVPVESGKYNLERDEWSMPYEAVLVKALERFGSQAVPYLQEAINRKDKSFKKKRGHLLRILSTIDDPRVESILADSFSLSPEAVVGLGRKNAREKIPEIRKLLSLKINYKIPWVKEWLDDWNWQKIIASVNALSLMEDEGSIEEIISLLQSLDSGWLRRDIIRSSRGFIHQRYYDILLEYARSEIGGDDPFSVYFDPDQYDYGLEDLKREALISLLCYNTDESIELLSTYLNENEAGIYQFIKNLFDSLIEHNQAEVISRIHKDIEDEKIKKMAVRALGILAKRNQVAADNLRLIVENGEKSASYSAWLELTKLADPTDLPLMQEVIMQEGDILQEEKKLAFLALARMGKEGQQVVLETYEQTENEKTLLATFPALFTMPGQESSQIGVFLDRLEEIIRNNLSQQQQRDREEGMFRPFSGEEIKHHFFNILKETQDSYVSQILERMLTFVNSGHLWNREYVNLPLMRHSKRLIPIIQNFLEEHEYVMDLQFLHFIKDELNRDIGFEFLTQIVEQSDAIMIKQHALYGLLRYVDDRENPSSKERRQRVFKIVKNIISQYKRDPSDPDFDDLEIIELREMAVESLPTFEASYELNSSILKDENERRVIRETARNNLNRYNLELGGITIEEFVEAEALSGSPDEERSIEVVNQQEEQPSAQKKLLAWMKKIRRRRRIKEIKRLQESYQNIAEPQVNAEEISDLDEFRTQVTQEELPQEDEQRHEDAPTEVDLGENVFVSDPEHAPTPRVTSTDADDNRFIEVLSTNTDKSKEEIEAELDYYVQKKHYEMLHINGFVDRADSEQAEVVYRIFDRVVNAYNELARRQNQPAFRGRLFIVDSPDVNAFVFSEHDDVYLSLGIIRELANFCQNENISFNEDLIAAVLGHEFTHIMQHSSYEGISFSDYQENKLLINEILDLKRQAEYNADQGAVALLSMAGYNPEAMLHTLNFLSRLTKRTSAEYAIADHPHPKERIVNLQNYLEDDTRVFSNWNKSFSSLDADEFINWNHKHLGSRANEIHSIEDIINRLESAQSIEEVIELVKIARYLEDSLYGLTLAETDLAEVGFAREVFVNSVLDVMKAVVARKTIGEGEKISPSLAIADEEGLLLHRLARDEEQRIDEDALFMRSNRERMTLATSQDFYAEEMSKKVAEIKKEVRESQLDSVEKIALLDLLDTLYAEALNHLQLIAEGAGTFESFVRSDPGEQEDFNEIVESILTGDLSSLRRLVEHPYSIYHVYGKDSLDEEIQLSDYLKAVPGAAISRTGIDISNLDLGKVYLERSDSNFYTPDLRLLGVSTPEQRRYLFQAIMIPFLRNRAREMTEIGDRTFNAMDSWSEHTYKSRRLQEAIRDATLRTAPDMPEELMTTEELQQRDQMNGRMKQWLGLHLADERNLEIERFRGTEQEREERRRNRERFIRYVHDTIKGEAEEIFSSVFSQEYSANPRIASKELFDFPSSRAREGLDYRYVELNNDTYVVVDYLVREIIAINKRYERDNPGRQDAATQQRKWQEKETFIREELSHFSIFFRKSILTRLTAQARFEGHYFKPTVTQLKNLMEGLIYPSDAYSILMGYATTYPHDSVDEIELEEQDLQREIETFEWIMDHKPSSLPSFSKDFLHNYVLLRLRELVEEESEINISHMDPDQIKDFAERHLSPEFVFDILNRVTRGGELDYTIFSELQSVSGRDEFAVGMISQDTKTEMETAALRGETVNRELASEDTPAAFFSGPKHILEQRLFCKMFDLSLEQLQTLAQNQSRVREDLVIKRGRLEQLPKVKGAQALIDQLILVRMMARHNLYTEEISSQDFSSVLKVTLDEMKNNYTGDVHLDFNITRSRLYADSLSNRAQPLSDILVETLNLDSREPEHRDRAFSFFQEWLQGGVIGKYDDIDVFLTTISQTSIGLQLFILYADIMTNMQLPEPKKDALEPSEESRTYLEALAQSVDLKGHKAEVFKKYDQTRSRLLSSTKPLGERLRLLNHFLPKASLFRDGFVDQWERNILPEIDLSRTEKIGMYVMRQEQKSRLKDDYELFETIALMTPLQWEKLKEERFDLPLERAEAVLDFYRQTIGLIADPQRQLRMGATAIKIFRAVYPEATFDEERRAIEDFFPFASELRDTELNTLLERHIVPSEEVSIEDLNEVRMLFTDYQNMQYDEELTNANYAEQMIKAILASASREDRLEILLWVLDPDAFDKPALIVQMKDKFNIDFDELPYHISFMPESYREKVLENMFLGENGLFSPQSEADEELMDGMLDTLFEKFFPPPEEGERRLFRRKKRLMDPQVYNIVREFFPIVMKKYSPSRRTSIAMALLKLHDRKDSMSQGEKLAVLLSALGPVGIKIGQILSENKHIIRDDALRSDLASLKQSAAPISKLAVLEILEQAGIDLKDVRIGQRLGSASMKQVHEGWIRIDGQWRHVVFKVLKPKIQRTIDKDIEVLKEVLQYLNERYGYNVQNIAETIEEWINTEKDFRIEGKNGLEIEGVIESYYEDYPERKTKDRVIDTPQIIVGDKIAVMIEDMVEGIEIDQLMRPKGLRSWLRGDGWKTKKTMQDALVKKGFSSRQAKKILSIKRSDIMSDLRDNLLFQILEKGKFHADMHSANVMLGADGHLYLIDLGLIGNLNEQQRQGVRKMIKGMILHGEDGVELIFEGIRDIHVFSGDIEEGQRDALFEEIERNRRGIEEEIRRIFKKRQNIKSEANDITALIVQKNFEGRSDFSKFMKAFTTAVWLFPTEISTALPAVNALAKALDLSKTEYTRAIRTHWWPVLKNTMDLAISNWKQDVSIMIGNALAPFNKRIDNLKQNISRIRLVREANNNFLKLFGRRDKESSLTLEEDQNLDEIIDESPVEAEWDEPEESDESSPETAEELVEVANVSIDRSAFIGGTRTMKLSQLEIIIDEETLSNIEAYRELDETKQQEVKESIETYMKIYSLIEHSQLELGATSDTIRNAKETFLVDKLWQREFNSKMSINDFIARVLTARIMRNKHVGLEQTQEEKTFYQDFLSPQNPILKAIGESLAELYLKSLDELDAQKGLCEISDGQRRRRRDLLMELNPELASFWISFRSPWKLIISDQHPGGDTRVQYQKQESIALSGIYSSFPVRASLKRNKSAIKPGMYTSLEAGTLRINVTRTGYTDTGRFKIDILNTERNEFLHLSLSEEEFDRFTKTGQATAVYSERWDTVVPESSEEQADAVIPEGLVENSLLNMETADGSSEDNNNNPEADDIDSPEEIFEINMGGEENFLENNVGFIPQVNDIGYAPGGIDLNTQNLNLKIETDGERVNLPDLPFDIQELENGSFEGLFPVIIDISPTSLPLLLGGTEEGSEEVGAVPSIS